jgi:RND family efflux transporter MFP subunit
MPVEVAANGTVVSESVVTIRPRVDGQITQLHVTEGQMVQRGQPLFTLDARFYRALLAQQEAQLAALRAQATRTQADAVRYQALRGEGFTAAQRFEQAQADAATAAANARATEAIIQQTRLNIEFASITAEADGKLGALPLRVGNFVRLAEATPLGTITQMDPILVQFAVPSAGCRSCARRWPAARSRCRPRRTWPGRSPSRGSWCSSTARWTPRPAPSSCAPASATPTAISGPANTCGCGWWRRSRPMPSASPPPRCRPARAGASSS